MIKPKAIKFGDTLGIVAPAGPVHGEVLSMSKKVIEDFGFKVKMGESCFKTYGYLAGYDYIRAQDINSMFSDREVDGIFCLRGGYGSSKILNLIDYEIIKNNPKVFVGYSDITSLHIAINKWCEMVTFHGPMVASDMINDFDDFSKESLFKFIMKNEPFVDIENPKDEKIKCLVSGRAKGTLVGGNLSVMVASIGTQYEINTKNKILFIEEIGEEPYRIDRMLTQLLLCGKLHEASGIVLGDFKNCEPKSALDSLSLMQVFNDVIKPINIPVIYNVKAGHCANKITLPFGVNAYLDAGNMLLKIEESAVL